jgi:hypothetical protein
MKPYQPQREDFKKIIFLFNVMQPKLKSNMWFESYDMRTKFHNHIDFPWNGFPLPLIPTSGPIA